MGSRELLQKELFAERTEGMNDCFNFLSVAFLSSLQCTCTETLWILPSWCVSHCPLSPRSLCFWARRLSLPIKVTAEASQCPDCHDKRDKGQSGNMVPAEFLDLPNLPEYKQSNKIGKLKPMDF